MLKEQIHWLNAKPIQDSRLGATPNYLAFLSRPSPLNAAKTFLKNGYVYLCANA